MKFPDDEFVKVVEPDDPIPDDLPLLELAEQVARGKRKVSPQQMRILIELLPYYAPKLTAIAVGHLTAQDFATRLDRAVDRSNRAKLIEGHATQVDDD
jgi:hypothetical protein